jgi:tRNA nucleotidyltransferase (CCA-adding enzyme)
LAWVSRLHGDLYRWDELRDSTKLRIAGQAVKGGICELLPLVAAADKGGGMEPPQWRAAARVAGMSATALGVDMEVLAQMDAAKRTDYILQKRIDAFRATPTACA